MQNGFYGSASGQQVSTIHGNLTNETLINREVKVRGGPIHGGYSTLGRTIDEFIKMSHGMAAIRLKL